MGPDSSQSVAKMQNATRRWWAVRNTNKKEERKPPTLSGWARQVIKRRVRQTGSTGDDYARSIRTIRDLEDGLTSRTWWWGLVGREKGSMEPVASKGRRGYIRDATGGPGLEARSVACASLLGGGERWEEAIMTRHWANDIGQRDQRQTTWTSDRHRGMVARRGGGTRRPAQAQLGRRKLSRKGAVAERGQGRVAPLRSARGQRSIVSYEALLAFVCTRYGALCDRPSGMDEAVSDRRDVTARAGAAGVCGRRGRTMPRHWLSVAGRGLGDGKRALRLRRIGPEIGRRLSRRVANGMEWLLRFAVSIRQIWFFFLQRWRGIVQWMICIARLGGGRMEAKWVLRLETCEGFGKGLTRRVGW